MKIKLILITAFLSLILAYFGIVKLAPACDLYGEPIEGSKTLSCECEGIKITVEDDAPVDGYTITKCLGTIKKSTCFEVTADRKRIPCSSGPLE